MENEFISKELWKRFDAVGIKIDTLVVNDGAAIPKEGITLEQLERCIWENHKELFFIIVPTFEFWDKGTAWEIVFPMCAELDNDLIYPDPFSARKAGLEQVIEKLEKLKEAADGQ